MSLHLQLLVLWSMMISEIMHNGMPILVQNRANAQLFYILSSSSGALCTVLTVALLYEDDNVYCRAPVKVVVAYF